MQSADFHPTTMTPHLAVVENIEWPEAQSRSSSLSDEHVYHPKPRPARLSMDFRPIEPVSRKQEMQRTFRLVSTIGFTSLVTGTWEVLLTGNANALVNGGIPGLVWSMICAHFGQLFIVLSMAEITSMVPAAGSPYQWVSAFARPRHGRMLSYLTGSLCSIGWQARFTAICYIVAGELNL